MQRRKLKRVYDSIKETLRNVMDIDEELQHYQHLDYSTWTDTEFFRILTRSIFTGIRNTIITNRWPAVTKAFSNFKIDKVANYTEKDVKRLMENEKIIRHEGRIRGTIVNARKMEEIIREHGSFVNYIDSFSSKDDLIEKLQGYYGGFKWVGEINAFEFAKEIGLPFIKPDRQIRRVFLRLGLIDEETPRKDIVEMGKAIAETVKEKLCAVDCVLWLFGSEICKAKPLCEKCSLTESCSFNLTKESSMDYNKTM